MARGGGKGVDQEKVTTMKDDLTRLPARCAEVYAE